ncbi:hypothetical protein [Kordia sp.]|uniref:hypothetical protein n=1 Tax=Kordia sp. TaxID=1965332 RepID=UPI003D26AF3A
MKKRSLKKISLQKTIISCLSTTNKVAKLLGGFEARGTSPKCAYSEWETCPSNQE